MKKLVATIVLAIVVVASLGCTAATGPKESPKGRRQAVTGGPAVTIQPSAFDPRIITVNVGDTVTWTNKDTAPHVVSGTGFASGRLAPGETYSHRFDTPGTYNYVSTIDQTMVGIVVAK